MMDKNHNNLIDISICIPTYNRSMLLKNCLLHLHTFTSINFEIIIGDNASTDDTPQMVDDISDKFTHFAYHRHTHNIGFARNMDAILRMARGEYIYILSDDDLIFENALTLMKGLLDANPTAVCISGQYQGTTQTEIGANNEYVNTSVRFFKHGNYSDLVDNFLACDGHPFMRRKIFQQHCMYNDRCFCLVPLFFKLLSLGDIFFVQQPIFQHFRNPNSLTTNMTKQWFIDYVNADIEISVAGIKEFLPPESVEIMRHRILKIVYFQASRMASLKENYTLMWHFLQRLKAIGEIKEECLAKCEINFMLKLIIERISKIASDTGTTTIWYEETPLITSLIEHLKNGTNLVFNNTEPKNQPPKGQLYLLQSYNNTLIDESNLTNIVSFTDLLNAFRLTTNKIGVNVNNDEVKIYFTEEPGIQLINSYSRCFETLTLKYSE